jgi:molybdopterin-dependent oxidoreductase alpha subunit
MVNEAGRFPEVCKKSLQAMVADMQPGIADAFWDEYPIERLRALSPRQLEHCGRLVGPVRAMRHEGRYRLVAWDEALRRIANTLRDASPDTTFWYFSGRSSNEAGFLLQLFARLYGTNNVNNCSYYCHQASGVGLTSVTGSGTATIVLDDLDHADLVFLIGGNPASNHPRLMRSLMQLRRRGGHVVVINPVVEPALVRFRVPSDPWSLLWGTRIATHYVQPHIGGDLALLTGIAKRVAELGAVDETFLREHCRGWAELADSLERVSWNEVIHKSGVAHEQIDRTARVYAASRGTVFAWTMGITQHTHGVENVQALGNLALIRGMVGRRGAGLLPVRGHSNVQGIGSVGVTPQLKQAVFDNLEKHLGVRLPNTPGLDTMGCMEAAAAGGLRVGVCLGGNLFGSNPDAHFAREALSRLDLIVYLSTTLNTGHAHGLAKETIILPVLARDEEPQPTTQESMFNYVRLSDGGPRRHAGPRSEIEIVADLAERVLGGDGPLDWRTMRETKRIRDAIGRIVPGWEKLREIDRTREEFQIGGRTFHNPLFATADGRAQLHVHTLPDVVLEVGELLLTTVRSEGQFNTVVYEDHDVYRGIDGRDVILLNPYDMAKRSLQSEDRVTVRSRTGSMQSVRAIGFDNIKAGNALMYYPEANVLVGRGVDPRSRTPSFKRTCVVVERQGLNDRA